ncbi:hypothetical protein EIP86_009472 [Pleurotus ostreatoroseus]|nr:hypothetical protein EIP86_009472 [Pleurotus ostreatoroseus]
MSAKPHFPPLDGSITVLPGLLDFHAEHNPDSPWALYPSSDATATSISFSDVAQATHRVAHGLRPDGTPGGRDVVVMLIHCDTILYVTMLVGIARAGMVPFPVSPRFSPEAITHLLKKSCCRRVLTQPSLVHLLSDAKAVFTADGISLQVDDLPSIHQIYPSMDPNSSPKIEEVSFPALKKPGNDETALYLHSAGSTGLPKPIALNQKIIIQWINNPLFTGSRDHCVRWAAMALPTFHSMGILTQLMAPLVSGQPVGVYEPKYPGPPVVPNPQNLLNATRICGCNAVMTVPSFIEVWAESEDSVKFMASLKMVFFGGGPLSLENGSKLIARGVTLVSGYGVTEAGPVAHPFDGFDADPSDPNARTLEDWQWQRISPLTKPRWMPQGDGTYELQFLTCETHQPSVENLPDAKGYATSDLWEPHPTKKGLWRIVGRKDDVIVLGSGEKIVPIPQERYIASHPLIADVVMFGRAKPQAGILVDPIPEYAIDPKDEAGVAKFIDQIWPYIEQANEDAPTFARIFREMVLFTDPAKPPLPRATKGNIVRKHALEMYADAIEHLYEESNADLRSVSCPATWEAVEVESWLLSLTASINHGFLLQPTIDIFEQGFDSLHATFVRNHIVNALKASQNLDIQSAAKLIDQNIVYANPMIRLLASSVSSIVLTKAAGSHTTKQVQLIQELVDKYSVDMPSFHRGQEVPRNDVVVFLTGSTGSIGSYILAELLADARVAKVYAFNRPSHSSTDRQAVSFRERQLSEDLLRTSKFIPVFGDLNNTDFGLSEDVLHKISSSVTHIIHNGWRVNFNHALSSFESQIAGTRNLVDFSASIGRPTRMLFTSSVGVAHSWPADKGLVPETPLLNPQFASDSGYSASKYVVEQILSKAHENGLEVTSLRVGQVCGSDMSGAWNVTDWVPILVKSALSMGCLPDLDESITWIPVDAVASCFVDFMFSVNTLPPLANLLHPRPIDWRIIVDALAEELQTSLPLISLDDWLSKISALADNATPEEMKKIPAIKLLNFFRSLSVGRGTRPVFDTQKLQEVSEVMKTLDSIGPNHARMWAKYWRSQGFF